MTRILMFATLTGLTGCTPVQIAAWHDWHDHDPEAAVAFLDEPWVRDELEHHRHPPSRRPTPVAPATRGSVAAGRCGTAWPSASPVATGHTTGVPAMTAGSSSAVDVAGDGRHPVRRLRLAGHS